MDFRQKRPFSKHWSGLVWLLLLWLLWPVVLVQAQAPLTVDDYWATLADLQPRIEALAALPEPEQAEARGALIEDLAEITAVSLPDGRITPVSQGHLQALLADASSDPADIAQLLQNQLDNRHHWPPPTTDQLDQETLQTILGRAEFRYEMLEPTWWQRLWQRVQLWFWEQLLRLEVSTTATDWLGLMVLIIASFLVLLVLLYVLRHLRDNFAAEARSDLGDDPHLDNITADTALQRAQESSSTGNYRQAVRYLYLSTLLLLEERDLLRYDRTLTNREYLNRLAHRPDLAAVLRDVVDVFDRVWYGFQPLSEGEYGRFADQVHALKQQKGGHP